jgi:hypothetical protein
MTLPSGALKMRTARPTFQGPRWIPKGKAPRECVWQCWIYCSSVITPGKQLNRVNQLRPLISYLPETDQNVVTEPSTGQILAGPGYWGCPEDAAVLSAGGFSRSFFFAWRFFNSFCVSASICWRFCNTSNSRSLRSPAGASSISFLREAR